MDKPTRAAKFTPSDDNRREIGKRVRVRMISLGYSCKDLAEITGYSIAYISRLRQGAQYPASTQSAIRFANALNVTLDELIFGK